MRSGVIFPSYGAEAVWSGTGWSASFPVANLADLVSIRKVARASDATARTIDFVLPAARTVQALAMLHHNAPYGATFQVWLFNDANPDPVGNPGAIVYNSGVIAAWPSDPGSIIFPAARPLVLPAGLTVRSGQITLTSRAGLDATAWEIGGVEVGGWWEWLDVEVPRELGVQNTDTVSRQADSVSHAMAQWAPRVWSGSRDVVDQSELETTALDFFRDRGLTKPFVFNWDADDPVTWARETILVRNSRLPPPSFMLGDVGRFAVNFIEHLG